MQLRPIVWTLAAGGAVIALALPAAAYAEGVHHHDPAHDVQQVHFSDGSTTAKPHNKAADIVGVDLDFTKKHVLISIRARAAAPGWLFGATIKTPRRTYTVEGTHDDTSTEFVLSKGRTAGGPPVACPDLAGTADPDAATITVKVPVSCVKDPHWIRAGVALLVPVADGFNADDGLRKRGVAHEVGVTLSPRLHHH